MLALATALLTVWIAPVTRHGIGAIGTGNHADLPSYLLQATYLFNHGFDATAVLPGIAPEQPGCSTGSARAPCWRRPPRSRRRRRSGSWPR